MHAAEVKLTGKQLASIMKLKERHHVQDLKEIFGMKKKFDRVQPAGYFTQNGTSSARVSTLEEVRWKMFREVIFGMFSGEKMFPS